MKILCLLFLITWNLSEASCEQNNDRHVVSTPLGQLEGYVGLTVNSIPFYKFEGVQYAKPPVGNLRFQKPQDPEPWTGIWKANVLTRCLQYDHFTQDFQKAYVVHGDEDCLHVNVYTKSLNQTANRPVLVHVHGGAFMFGRGASYGPEIIMDREVVYVNFNYRLGPLGFLSTEDEILPGNNGLRDQVKALEWIKRNIHYFGGDPDSITIHGLSAGGASVQLHYLLPASKGLFQRGISQSGCALNPWVLMENARERTKKLADSVGCPTDTSEEILKCLKSKPARHIVQAVNHFQPWLYNPFSPFGVVVDGQWAKDPVLPDHPYNLLKQGKVQDIPWVISYVKEEGLYPASEFYSDDQYLIDIDTKWNDIVPLILHYNDSVDPLLRDEISEKIRKEYLGQRPVTKETFPILVELISDRLFVADIEMAARMHSAAVKSDTYSYKFEYRGAVSKSDSRTKSDVNVGVSHGDDTVYICKAPDIDTLSTEADRNMSKVLLDMIISFMTTSKPDTVPIDWLPLRKSMSMPFIILKILGPKEFEVEFTLEVGRSKFWNSLPFKENHYFIKKPKEEL